MIRFGAPTALVALVAAGLLFGPDGFSPEPRNAEAALLIEVKKILASDAQAGDWFGISVAVSSDTAVVGAYKEDGGGISAGAAYVFQRDEFGADNWGQVKKLTASDAQAFDWFGYSVAVSGDTAVVGAANGGSAYVFQRDHGGADNWGEVSKLTAFEAEANGFFGSSVALSGDTAVVGAFLEDAGSNEAGAAYVFQRDQGGTDNWGEVSKLTASDAEAKDRFGIVALSGDTAVVGAFQEDAGGNDAGAAYLFQRDQGGPDNWGEVTKLAASDAEAGDQFGGNVALSGDTAVVGAFREDTGGSDAGGAYVFQRDQGGADNWGEVKKLTAADADADDNFGVSVTVSGNTAVVGAWGESAGGSEAGASYVFQRDQGGADNWGEVTKLTASDTEAGDRFGISVAVGGLTAVVAAWGEDTGGNNAGTAYIFDLPLPKLPEPGDSDGDGCSDLRENGPDETLGGQRNYKNRWDFYDVNGDQIVDLTNDIFDVIQHYAPTGKEATYNVNFDRGPSAGPNVWNMTAPDGVIDLSNDILGVIAQYFHSCQ